MTNPKIKPELEKTKPSWGTHLDKLIDIQSKRISNLSEIMDVLSAKLDIANKRIDNIMEHIDNFSRTIWDKELGDK